MRSKVALTATLVAVMLALAVVNMSGCKTWGAEQDAGTARLQAEATLVRAEADLLQVRSEAYQQQVQADVQAAAERANIRQMERDASHERTLELLPFTVLLVGLMGVVCLVVWVLATGWRRATLDAAMVLLFGRQEKRLQEVERALYHMIAVSQRRALRGEDEEIIVYKSPRGGNE